MNASTQTVSSIAPRRNVLATDPDALRVVIDYTGALLDVNGAFDDCETFQVFRGEDAAWLAIMSAAERFDREYCEFDVLPLAWIHDLTREGRRLEHALNADRDDERPF